MSKKKEYVTRKEYEELKTELEEVKSKCIVPEEKHGTLSEETPEEETVEEESLEEDVEEEAEEVEPTEPEENAEQTPPSDTEE